MPLGLSGCQNGFHRRETREANGSSSSGGADLGRGDVCGRRARLRRLTRSSRRRRWSRRWTASTWRWPGRPATPPSLRPAATPVAQRRSTRRRPGKRSIAPSSPRTSGWSSGRGAAAALVGEDGTDHRWRRRVGCRRRGHRQRQEGCADRCGDRRRRSLDIRGDSPALRKSFHRADQGDGTAHTSRPFFSRTDREAEAVNRARLERGPELEEDARALAAAGADVET